MRCELPARPFSLFFAFPFLCLPCVVLPCGQADIKRIRCQPFFARARSASTLSTLSSLAADLPAMGLLGLVDYESGSESGGEEQPSAPSAAPPKPVAAAQKRGLLSSLPASSTAAPKARPAAKCNCNLPSYSTDLLPGLIDGFATGIWSSARTAASPRCWKEGCFPCHCQATALRRRGAQLRAMSPAVYDVSCSCCSC